MYQVVGLLFQFRFLPSSAIMKIYLTSDSKTQGSWEGEKATFQFPSLFQAQFSEVFGLNHHQNAGNIRTSPNPSLQKATATNIVTLPIKAV